MSGSSSPGHAGSRVQITPRYSYLSEKLRQMSAGSLQCSLFCGGRGCKWEGAVRWAESDQAVKGVFSHWVTPTILAMARPSTHLIRDRDLLAEFKRQGICSVINLQLPGEHGQCGPGLEHSSGFTYRPEDFMNNGVYFYNYGWVDYGVPTLSSLLDMVRVMDFALAEGKVAVHCHAGLGRTGVLIACYLCYSLRMGGMEAVATVREKRPGAIQSRSQLRIVLTFASSLSPLWTFFPPSHAPSSSSPTPSSSSPAPPSPSSPSPPSPMTPMTPCSLGLEELIRNQAQILHGQQNPINRDVPKVVDEVCKRLLDISSHDQPMESCDQPTESCDSEGLRGAVECWAGGAAPSDHTHSRVTSIREEVNSSLEWVELHSEPSPAPLLHLLTTFLYSLKAPVLSCISDMVWLFPPHSRNYGNPLSKASHSTALRVIDTMGTLLLRSRQEATPIEATATDTQVAMATPSLPELQRLVAEKVVEDLTQQKGRNSQGGDDTVPELKAGSTSCQAVVAMVIQHWKQFPVRPLQ